MAWGRATTRRRGGAGPSRPRHIKGLISRWVSRAGLEEQLLPHQIADAWTTMVGQRIAARTRPLSLREGELRVSVENSAWLTELNLLRTQMLHRINQGCGAGRVRALKLVAGRTRPLGAGPQPHDVSQPKPLPPPSQQMYAQASHTVAGLTESPLRDAIRNAQLAQLRFLSDSKAP